jgi:hypothetical protein
MSGQSDEKRGKVPLKPFLEDFRANLPDRELMKKYRLSAQAFVRLVKALLAKKIVTPTDLSRRKEASVQRDLAKQSEFLSGLFICPNCGHPHPMPFEVCPACDTNVKALLPDESASESLTTTHAHIYVNDSGEREIVEPEDSDGLQDVPENEPNEDKPKPRKSSALKSVRSFLSGKLKKKKK